MTQVLVTGATGFIGRHFLSFATAHGLGLRPVFRAADQIGAWRDAVVAGDLTAYQDWRTALAGVHAVVHLAARAHRPLHIQVAERALYKRINTELAARAAEEAAAAGVSHFVFMSSIGVHGRSTDGRAPFSESDRLNPAGPYAETKAEAERRLSEIARRSGMALTVIRPVLVYGKGAKGNFAMLVRAIRAGLPLPLATVRNHRAFLAAENLSSLILHRLQAGPRGHETFIVADDERVSTPELILRLGEALHRKPVLLPFPPAILRRALVAAGRSQMADGLLSSLDVDTSAAKRTGWRAVLTMHDALARAVADLTAAAP